MARMFATSLAVLFAVSSFGADVELRRVLIPDAPKGGQWADFNGDGLDDVLHKNQLRFNLGGRLGPPVTVPQIVSTPEVSTSAGRAADYSGDGKADLLLRSSLAGVPDRLLIGDGFGGFSEAPLPLSREQLVLANGDFSGDGLADLIAITRTTLVLTLLRNNGNATFAVHQELPWPDRSSYDLAERIVIEDVSGDGIRDLAMAHGERLYIYYGSPNGAFSGPRVRFTRTEMYEVNVADIDADGRPDLTAVQTFDQMPGLSVAMGDGRGHFPRFTRLRVEPPEGTQDPRRWAPSFMVVGDLVPGGGDEIVYATYSGTVRLVAMNHGALRELGSVDLERVFLQFGERVAGAPGLQRVSFRAPGKRDVIVEGWGTEGAPRITEQVWHLEIRGALAGTQSVPQRSRMRATGRTVRDISGEYDVSLTETSCPFSLAGLKISLEGMFVDVEPNAQIRGADAVYIEGSLWMELTFQDGAATRVVRGMLRPTANGFSGTWFESGATPCGGSQRHTAVISRRPANR